MSIGDEIREAQRPHMRQMVEVKIMVPLSELDLDACYAHRETHTEEMHGVPVVREVWNTDLTGALWEGHDVEVCEEFYGVVSARLQEERS
jgi:hypothetical protein